MKNGIVTLLPSVALLNENKERVIRNVLSIHIETRRLMGMKSTAARGTREFVSEIPARVPRWDFTQNRGATLHAGAKTYGLGHLICSGKSLG